MDIKTYNSYINQGCIMVKIKSNKQPWNYWGVNIESAPYNENNLYSFMPAPHMLVIDVDIKNDLPGLESFERFQLDTGITDCWYNVKTGSGGYHYYFYYPTDLPHLKKKQTAYPGLDFLHHKTELCVAGGQVLDNGEYIINQDKKLQFNKTPKYTINNKLEYKLNLSNQKYMKNGVHVPLLEMCKEFNNSNLSPDQVNACLELISPDDYNIWITVGMILKQHLGDSGFDLYDAWSARSDKYVGADDVYSHWKSFKEKDVTIENAVTYGTLIYHALETKYSILQNELQQCRTKEEVMGVMKKDTFLKYPRFLNTFIYDKIPVFLKTLDYFKKYSKDALEEMCREVYVDKEADLIENQDLQELVTTIFSRFIRLVYDTSKNHFYDLERNTNVDKMYIQTQIYPIKKELCELYKVKNFTIELAIQLELIKTAVLMDYNPTIKERLYTNKDGALVFNTFRYDTIPPLASVITAEGWGYINLLKIHAENLLGSDYSKIVLSYFAYMVQNPGKKVNWIPIIQGCQGVGKTLFVNALARCCFGKKNYDSIGTEEIIKEHTGWAVNKLLVIIPELKIDWKISKEVMERLKPIITDEKIRYVEKYKISDTVTNTLNIIATTNYENPVPLEHTDRRYCIMFSKSTTKMEMLELIGDNSHFDKLASIISCSDEIAGQVRRYFMEYKIDSIFKPLELPAINDNKSSYYEGVITASSQNEYFAELIKAVYGKFPADYIDSKKLIEYHNNDFNKDDFNYYIKKLSYRRLNSILKSFGYKSHAKWYYHSTINRSEAAAYIDKYNKDRSEAARAEIMLDLRQIL